MIFFIYENGPSGDGVAYYSRRTSSEYNRFGDNKGDAKSYQFN